MSRKNKNLRAFLHQNPNPTIEQAWDAAWEGAQKVYHAKRIAALEAEVQRLTEIEAAAIEFVRDSYRPTPKYDAMRFDKLAALLPGRGE